MRRFSLPDLRLLGGARWAAGGAPVLAQLPTIPTFQELRPAIDGELRRSRRYERPLSVLVIAPEGEPSSVPSGTNGGGGHTNGPNGARNSNGGVRDDAGSLVAQSGSLLTPELLDAGARPLYWAQLRFQLLGSVLCGTLRESDIVGYAVEVHEFVALLPECDDAAARRTVARLRELYFSRVGTGLRAGMAVYPRDGLTLDDLVAHARRARASVDHRATMHADEDHNGHGAADE
jgi:hypothetical protein